MCLLQVPRSEHLAAARAAMLAEAERDDRDEIEQAVKAREPTDDEVNSAVEKAMDDLAKQRRAKAAAEAKAKRAEQTALAQRAKVLYDLSRKRASQSAAARKAKKAEAEQWEDWSLRKQKTPTLPHEEAARLAAAEAKEAAEVKAAAEAKAAAAEQMQVAKELEEKAAAAEAAAAAAKTKEEKAAAEAEAEAAKVEVRHMYKPGVRVSLGCRTSYRGGAQLTLDFRTAFRRKCFSPPLFPPSGSDTVLEGQKGG